MGQITAKMLLEAKASTQFHRSQVRCFCYPMADGRKRHVVRDGTLKLADQTIWTEIGSEADYADLVRKADAFAEEYKAHLIADQLNKVSQKRIERFSVQKAVPRVRGVQKDWDAEPDLRAAVKREMSEHLGWTLRLHDVVTWSIAFNKDTGHHEVRATVEVVVPE